MRIVKLLQLSMTTPEDVLAILKKKEKETLTVELKRSAVLLQQDSRRDLAYEIVALANRRGGKIILGINDDGTFEGKSIFQSVDKLKGYIDNICYVQISPLIEYRFEYLEMEEGDLIVLNIPRKNDIPHAYINKRDGEQIKTRIYYIRTSYGKRLIGDNQLRWLFKYDGEANFSKSFRTVLTYQKDNLNFLPDLIEQPTCIFSYFDLSKNITSDLVKHPLMQKAFRRQTTTQFLAGITPYVFIRNLSSYFINSWICEITRRHPFGKNFQVSFSQPPRSSQQGSQEIDHASLPEPRAIDSILSSYKSQIIQNSIAPNGFREKSSLFFPPETTISISYDGIATWNRITLVLQGKYFKFDISFSNFNMSDGPASGNPIWEIISNQTSSLEEIHENKFYKELESIEFRGKFNAEFNFPEEDIDSFQYLYKYAKNIEDIINHEWDYDFFIENLSDRKLYSIEYKLDNLISCQGDSGLRT